MSLVSPNYTLITHADAKAGDLISMWVRRVRQPYLVLRKVDEKAGNPLMLLSLAEGFKCFFANPWPKHILRVGDEWRFNLKDESTALHEHGFAPDPGRLCLAANKRFLVIQMGAFQNQLFEPALANLKLFEIDDRPEGSCVSFEWVIETKDEGTNSWEPFFEPRPHVEVVA